MKKDIELNRSGYLQSKSLGLVHRHAFKQHYGAIKKGWIVHHIDGDKINNRKENLIQMPAHCHDKLHAQMKHEGFLNRENIVMYIEQYLRDTALLKADFKDLIYEL